MPDSSPWNDSPNNFIHITKNIWNKIFKNNIKRKIGLVLFLIAIPLVSTGIYQVEEGEQALIIRFGKFVRVESPGLRYKLPYPIEVSYVRNVQRSRQIEIISGSDTSSSRSESRYSTVKSYEDSGNILTSDENLMRLRAVVTWHIKDLKNFLLKNQNTNEVIKKICESGIREVISETPISDALSNKKQEIADKMECIIQRLSDHYKTGIHIEKVQLLAIEPPIEVIEAYRDVQSSRADKENKINEAYAYRNSVIEEAKGQASKMIKEAEANKYALVSKAEGDTKYFQSLFNTYKDSPVITKHRLQTDYIEQILKSNNKIILESADKTLSYLPLDALAKKKKQTINPDK